MKNELSRLPSLIGILALATLSVTASFAEQHPLSKEEARKIVAPMYSMFNQPQTKDLKALSEVAMAPDWKSYSGQTAFKARDAFLGNVSYFGKLIPDLKWDIKELLVDGDRIVVIGEGSGTPVGPFFGVPVSGKSFKIMAIDVHTVRDGKLTVVYHVEDWAGAIQQLSAK